MCPCSPLCGVTVVIGPSRATLLLPPQGFPVFILPFEMLLQLPEQKLHCHLVMALDSYSPYSHRTVCQQDHMQSKVREHCVPSSFVSGFLTPPRLLLNLQNRSGSRPKDALVSAAAWGKSKSRMPGYEDCVCVCSSFLLHQCYPLVLEWLTSQ